MNSPVAEANAANSGGNPGPEFFHEEIKRKGI